MASPYLLDTGIVLLWTRGARPAEVLDEAYNLSTSPTRPLICEVTLGEMLAFSMKASWGADRMRRLAEIERHFVIVPISDSRVRYAYAELSTLAQSLGWSLFHGKNDLWVGAAARVTDAHLLTVDTDFLPLRTRPGWQVTVLDPRTALPVP